MSADEPLYKRDPEAWRAHLADGNAKQPRKRIGADVLLRDSSNRLLLVDPRYKPDWDLPGGMAEANEPPSETVKRELREELGLDLEIGRLLCVDWVSPHGPWDDSLMFIFDGGELSVQEISHIRLVDGEISSFEFCAKADAQKRLRSYVWQRVCGALDAQKTGHAIYLQDGRPFASKP